MEAQNVRKIGNYNQFLYIPSRPFSSGNEEKCHVRPADIDTLMINNMLRDGSDFAVRLYQYQRRLQCESQLWMV